MKYSQMSAPALAELIGERIRQYRLNSNKSQEELADITGVSRQKIARAENGKGSLETIMSLLIALDAVDHLDQFLPPVPISPIQLAKLKGKERQRASSTREKNEDQDSEEENLGW
ncbi:helix-turn-helix transcriptional regulator [Photobacterium kishitanii]|uniref:Transcriptional regulator n=1 Tax=Photobacterium kishitanii TaxID=318456 RepID=A0A2T3KM23_9GAMM|nr:helix-turn-helix transcriptional regulator [Photobacterium kishitanii]PSV00741.1 transcriptional regulator [Photobacterium kishitanii]